MGASKKMIDLPSCTSVWLPGQGASSSSLTRTDILQLLLRPMISSSRILPSSSTVCMKWCALCAGSLSRARRIQKPAAVVNQNQPTQQILQKVPKKDLEAPYDNREAEADLLLRV
jgi:hypothetical protein